MFAFARPGVISKKTALLLVFEINSKSIALTLVFFVYATKRNRISHSLHWRFVAT